EGPKRRLRLGVLHRSWARGLSERRRARLVRLLGSRVPLPTVEFDLDRLDRDLVRVPVECRDRGELADPTPMQEVTKGDLTLLVHHLQRELLLVAGEIHRNVAGEGMDLVGPVLEFDVVRDPAVEGQAVVLRPARRLVVGTILAARTMRN